MKIFQQPKQAYISYKYEAKCNLDFLKGNNFKERY